MLLSSTIPFVTIETKRKRGPDVLSDIEIAQATTPEHISAIAEKAGVPESYLEMYGTNKAKVDYNLLKDVEHTPGKLILVTAINPTPAGEGKTTRRWACPTRWRSRARTWSSRCASPAWAPCSA